MTRMRRIVVDGVPRDDGVRVIVERLAGVRIRIEARKLLLEISSRMRCPALNRFEVG